MAENEYLKMGDIMAVTLESVREDARKLAGGVMLEVTADEVRKKGFYPAWILQDADGRQHVESAKQLEVPRPVPDYLDRDIELFTEDSFDAYVKDFAFDHTRIYADPERRILIGNIDDHKGKEKPGAEKHEAFFEPALSDEWAAWINLANNGNISQEIFAEFLQEWALTIKKPGPVELSKAVLELRIRKDVAYTEQRNLINGEVELMYTESIQGEKRPGKIKLPDSFTVEMPVFQYGPPVAVEVMLRFRLREGVMAFSIKIHAQKKIQDEAFLGICARVQKATKCVLYFGHIQ